MIAWVSRWLWALVWAAKACIDEVGTWFGQDLPPLPDSSWDHTPLFNQLLRQVIAGRTTLPADATDHVYLLVPGLFTDHYPGYFDDVRNRLLTRGLDVRLSSIDTEGSVEHNAATLHSEVLAISEATQPLGARRVVLIGHSKGGSDAVDTLRLYPELVPHVHAILSMQAPHFGTPVAQLLSAGPLPVVMGGFVENFLHGEAEAIYAYVPEERLRFTEAHPIPEGVTIVCLASCFRGVRSLLAVPAALFRARFDCDTDGLVPLESATLPDTHVVRTTHLDHARPSMNLGWRRSPGPDDITEAMLALTLDIETPHTS